MYVSEKTNDENIFITKQNFIDKLIFVQENLIELTQTITN